MTYIYWNTFQKDKELWCDKRLQLSHGAHQ